MGATTKYAFWNMVKVLPGNLGSSCSLFLSERASLILPFQARFEIFSHPISYSSKIKKLSITTSQFQARKINISISSKIRESKLQNLNYKQDSRIIKGPILAANGSS